MAHRYLLFFALLASSVITGVAQDLPANVNARSYSWYLSPSIAMLQTQRFESNSPTLLSAANAPQPALGIRLGYSHSPTIALEMGLHVLPNSSGFVANFEQVGIPRTYKNSQLYLPLAVVFQVWQPAPRLAVRAVVGGGVHLQNEFGSFTDTLRYASTASGVWDSRLMVSQHGTSRTIRYAAELGLRAEWQASPKVFIGFEVKDLLCLTAPADNTISVTDEATRAVLANARITARRQTLWAGINVRYIFHAGTSYQYHPAQ